MLVLRRLVPRQNLSILSTASHVRVRISAVQFGRVQWKSTVTSATTAASAKKPLFPERLIIYHAGTGRTVFLGCLKVTTIFICAFFCVVMAPTHFYSDEPKWGAACVMLSGIIPVSTVAYISAPYVTYIHIRLPAFARQSREMLIRYSQNLPKNTELDITTMNFIGKPRVARVNLSELRPVKERLGFANFARDTTKANAKRPWWMGSAQRQFGVHNEKSGIVKGEVWEIVAKSIAKNR